MQITEHKVWGKILQSQLLLQVEGVDHLSTTRESTIKDIPIWMPRQIHSDRCIVLSPELISSENIPEADAVICNISGQWIGVRTADCVPILLYDPIQKLSAAIHAGWRGTAQHIVRRTIQQMKSQYGCQGANLYAVICPSISPVAFEVGDEVVQVFIQAKRSECVLTYANGHKPHIDLWQSNVMDLLEEGVELDHIDCTPLCTLTHVDMFYSARKEGIDTGRNISAIRCI